MPRGVYQRERRKKPAYKHVKQVQIQGMDKAKVLLEQHVDGRDLAVSLIEPVGGGEPMVLPVVEAIPHEDDRYEAGIGFDELIGRVVELALQGAR